MTAKDKTLKTSILINAPAHKVWNALKDPDMSQKYLFNSRVASTWKEGDPITFTGAEDNIVYVKGWIVKTEQEKLLSYTVINPHADMEDSPENYLTVTYELQPEGDATLVHVSQGDFATVANGEERYKHSAGGWDMTLKKLKETVENAS